MASSRRPCAINKCEISSCAVCHCCQNDLCLDHLKEHKDQLNAKLIPLANQINTFLDSLEHFNPISLPSFKILEQWRVAAHETVDQFYKRMRRELFEQKKDKPLEKLRITRDRLDQLIRKQGATHENINLLANDIRSIEQEINGLRNIQINLRPLVIDENAIVQSASSNRMEQLVRSNIAAQAASVDQIDLNALQNGTAFQIFVQLPIDKKILLTVKPLDTIMDIKRKIHHKENIPIGNQRLTYMGKQLIDDYLIANYDIQRRSTINLILNQRAPQEDGESS